MAFRLARPALDDGFRLEAHDTVGSTNALALERAAAGDPGRLWVVASRQEAGRGRRGRAWATPRGNLAATLLLVLGEEFRNAATLGFVAGLALSEALEEVAPGTRIDIGVDGGGGEGARRFELKWPNDVLTSGAKLAGILLESAPLRGGRFAVAVGIGVNVVAYPEGLPYRATSLAAIGAAANAEELFVALSAAWARNERLWDRGRGLAAVRNRWMARAAGLGGAVAVSLDGRVVRGTFETIDEECRFVIRDADGAMITITAGDVHFGAVASAGAA